MEGCSEAVRQTDKAQRQDLRQRMGAQLAEALAGGPVALEASKEGAAVLNPETGELLEDRAAAFAALLMLGADDENHIVGQLAGEGLQPFIGGMALWNPSLRLDPNWAEAMRRRSRKAAKEAWRGMMKTLPPEEKAARDGGWKHRLGEKLLTLTMPHLTGKTTVQEVERINAALALLKKREEWKAAVWGGIKGIEDKLTADGPHVHAHLLLLSRFINRESLSEAWRECVDSATRKIYGFGLAKDCPRPFLDIREVKEKLRPNRKGQENMASMDSALDEVSKYITKTSDLVTPDAKGRRIPREWLLELCEVERWPRMFEKLGAARKAGKQAGQGPALDLIHRAYSTGKPAHEPLPFGWERVEAWDHDLDGPEELRLAFVEKLKKSEKPPPKKHRPPSWRDLLSVLPFGDWLAEMVSRARRGRAFRLRWTLEHNPGAVLFNMAGAELT